MNPLENEHTRRALAGVFTGLCTTFTFTPYDKALYVSIKNKTSFFSAENWRHPFKGITNILAYRVLNNGVYYHLMDEFKDMTSGITKSKVKNDIIAGTALGITSSLMFNPLAVIKYRTWGYTEGRPTFRSIMGKIRSGEGITGFYRGIKSTTLRDCVFSVFYAPTQSIIKERYKDDPPMNFISLLGLSVFCTIASSPVNYIRRMRFAAAPLNPTWSEIIREFIRDYYQQLSLPDKMRFIITRFGIGWGTIRVGTSISMGQLIYNKLVD